MSSPSGCGKTTVANILVRDRSNNIVRSVSITTRLPRKGEVHGKDYFFVDEERFKELCDKGEMLEHAEVFGNFYGVPRKCVEENSEKGLHTLLVIDWQGAFRLMEVMKEHVVSVFLIPPSMEELSRRLQGRSGEDSLFVGTRLREAAFEIGHCYEYDYVIVNEDAEETAKKICHILSAEEMRTSRQVVLRECIEKSFPGSLS
ncbi:MAG: guanylate kinase [Aaplasma endosymbiont of Hyalomma asiaticum]